MNRIKKAKSGIGRYGSVIAEEKEVTDCNLGQADQAHKGI